jgi:hypothetical protein
VDKSTALDKDTATDRVVFYLGLPGVLSKRRTRAIRAVLNSGHDELMAEEAFRLLRVIEKRAVYCPDPTEDRMVLRDLWAYTTDRDKQVVLIWDVLRSLSATCRIETGAITIVGTKVGVAA